MRLQGIYDQLHHVCIRVCSPENHLLFGIPDEEMIVAREIHSLRYASMLLNILKIHFVVINFSKVPQPI